jgi:hypothetical protein
MKTKASKKPAAKKMKVTKYQSGGLAGAQKKLDINKNNKLDSMDFKILRKNK